MARHRIFHTLWLIIMALMLQQLTKNFVLYLFFLYHIWQKIISKSNGVICGQYKDKEGKLRKNKPNFKGH